MTTYNQILDSEIDPESPVTASLMTKIRNNPIALAEGAPGAPRINRRAITPGGTEADGAIIDATVMPTVPGFYEWDYITLTIAKTVPYVTIARIDGNCIISNAINASVVDTAAKQSLAQMLRCMIAPAGSATSGASSGGGGGASLGSGGAGSGLAPAGGAGLGTGALFRRWLEMRLVGGLGGAGGSGNAGGGGVFILYINGNLDMSVGGSLRADGAAGFGSAASGGGGGGTLIVVCNGTITGGTFSANGGTGGADIDGTNSGGGGGGGGYVAVVASTFAGSQTLTANGGAGGNGGGTVGSAGAAGVTEKLTLSEAQINGLLLR